ncbi:MAG: phosphoribosylanthranilate isomerase, partial [bacterium]|nr:phosphoribosylanthranilate isomerase [bacterium]
FSYPCYKALRIKDSEDSIDINRFPGPRVLVDAFSSGIYGGTGKRISGEVIEEAASVGPLWLAGGLSPGNIRNIVKQFKPDLVDVSSKLESEKGIKDLEKMRSFFREIDNGCL